MTAMGIDGEKTCSRCDAPMHQAQDWCLQCGLGASRGTGAGPGWRSAALAIGATGALVLGASAAAYAALQQSPPKRLAHVAQTPPSTAPSTPGTATTPGQATPGATIPNTPGGAQPPSTPSLKTPSTLPRIPSSTPTPTTNGRGAAQTTTSSRSGGAGSNGNKGPNAGKGRGRAGEGKEGNNANPPGKTHNNEEQGEGTESVTKPGQPIAILLDTDAAHLYNPDKLAASRFGDPSLAIDGDATTAWTMQLEPAEAPSVGAGLDLALNASLSVAQLTLITETVGITVQIYGARSATPPESLSSEGWVRLSKQHLVKKRNATIELGDSKKRFKQLLVWIVKAPTSVGGQFAGSEVAIDQIQLYEPKRGSR